MSKKSLKIGIMNCLNMANQSTERNAVDKAVLAYYAGLSVKGYTLVLHAVGSTEEDALAAGVAGWEYTQMPNDDMGKKRNAGFNALRKMKVDIIVRIGSDDIVSKALLDEIARRAKIGYEHYWELRGFYFYDVPSERMALFPFKQFALAFRVSKVDGPLYNEDGKTIDSGIDIKLRSQCYPWYMLTSSKDTPMIALKSGDEINGFDSYLTKEPSMYEMVKPKGVFSKYFNSFSLKPVSTTGEGEPDASTKN